MSDWMLLLNQLPEELEKVLPLTDARFRPDVRLLECGIYDQVSSNPSSVVHITVVARLLEAIINYQSIRGNLAAL